MIWSKLKGYIFDIDDYMYIRFGFFFDILFVGEIDIIWDNC